ncbi:hypothetical protein Arad_3587 [Rhizobium rhizogenes K84]|uniref:Uncharacterized protein n=1 Tax=Rhizobium rhizogenes (strain K84 / ATCC BAA-868) TaxID=311403 RepID=B9J8W4_RHIR8|nr:hypothetical protein Arad_3587 [Rhizobium rhizogenes K84]
MIPSVNPAGDGFDSGAHFRQETTDENTPSYTGKQAVIGTTTLDHGLLFIWHSSAVAFLPTCVTFSISINKICDF